MRRFVDLLILLALAAAVLASVPLLKRAEVWLFPVVTDFTIDRRESREGGAVAIAGNFVKARGCDYLDLTAFSFDPHSRADLSIRLPVQFEDQPEGISPSRASGVQTFGWWVIGPSPLSNPLIVIEARHRCHGLWTTRTQLARIPYKEKQ